jgi:hypothetical protein
MPTFVIAGTFLCTAKPKCWPPRGSISTVRSDHGFGRQSGFDQMLRRRRFDDPLAGPAGEPRPVRDNHPVLGRDHVEPLGSVFTDHVHRLLAAGAVGVGRRHRLVDARQMDGQRAAIDPSLPQRGGGLYPLLNRLGLGDRLFDIFQRQTELVGMSLASRSLLASKPCALCNSWRSFSFIAISRSRSAIAASRSAMAFARRERLQPIASEPRSPSGRIADCSWRATTCKRTCQDQAFH